MLTALAISNYRSLRKLIVPLKALNVITGANGSGKSNLYRALRLLADTAQGRVVPSLAGEGGLQSTLWAGPESISRRMRQGDCAKDSPSAFRLDPEIKRECIWHGPVLRPSTTLVDRQGPLIRVRSEDVGWNLVRNDLSTFDSMMTQMADPRHAPEMLVLRESIRAWRFYDHFRTDSDSPARSPQIGTRTPVLGNDGADLAAAVQTIREIGDWDALVAALTDAFPGSALSVQNNEGRFELLMEQHGLLRLLSAAELSDGTLRYLLWIAALLTPRPPALMVLNEPETSLHPDLLAPLARLVAHASEKSQIVVVTHAPRLIAALFEQPTCHSITLEKTFGQTTISGLREMDIPQWNWPTR